LINIQIVNSVDCYSYYKALLILLKSNIYKIIYKLFVYSFLFMVPFKYQRTENQNMNIFKLLLAYLITFLWALVSVWLALIVIYSFTMYFLDIWTIYNPFVFLSFPCAPISIWLFKFISVDMIPELSRMHRKNY